METIEEPTGKELVLRYSRMENCEVCVVRTGRTTTQLLDLFRKAGVGPVKFRPADKPGLMFMAKKEWPHKRFARIKRGFAVTRAT